MKGCISQAWPEPGCQLCRDLEECEILMLGGQPLNEVVYSYGPFVMNSEAEIIQCINDYNSGKMGNPSTVN